MRIMTFNVQHFRDYKNDRIDFDLFADFIREQNVDFCGLNEIRGDGPLKDYTDQTSTLADKLGFERYFGEAIKVKGSSPYGNAVICAKNIKSAETVKIPDPVFKFPWASYESRCIIRATAELDGAEIMLLVCHMGLVKSEKRNAVKEICRILDSSTLPCILMGDFNTTPENKLLHPIRKRMKDADALAEAKGYPTYPSDKPTEKLDYIFYRGLECTYCEAIKRVVSDHLPIIAEFRI